MSPYKHFEIVDLQTDCPLEWFVALFHALGPKSTPFYQSYPCNQVTSLLDCYECPFFEEHRLEL